MNKKTISLLALGLTTVNIVPIVANATEIVPTESDNISKTDVEAQNKENSTKTEVETPDKEPSTDNTTPEVLDTQAPVGENPQNKEDWAKDYKELKNPKKEDILNSKYSDKTNKKIEELTVKVDKLAGVPVKIETLKEVFTEIIALHNSMDKPDRIRYKDTDQLAYVIYKLNFIAYTNLYDNKELLADYYDFIADSIYLERVDNYNNKKVKPFIQDYLYYLQKLTIISKEENGQTIYKYFDFETNVSIQVATSWSVFLDKDGANGQKVPESKPSEEEKPDPDAPPIIPPEFDPNDPETEIPVYPEIPDYEGDGDEENEGGNDSKYDIEKYEKRGNGCYLVTETYQISDDNSADKLIKTISKILPSSDNFLCGMEVPMTDSPWGGNGQFNGSLAVDIWNSLDSESLNDLSTKTLQYSLNSKGEKPHYFDSGIKVSKDNTVTFTQIQDVLNQIAIKAKGKVVDDEGKLLFIADGQPMVLIAKKGEYSESEVNKLLDSFENIDLKIREKQTVGGQSLNDSLETGELTSITVNGKTHTLKNAPIIAESILQLPVEEVAKLMGYTVLSDANNISLSKDKVKITISKKDKTVLIGDKKKITATAPTVKDGVVYAEMNIPAKEIGLAIYYDKFNSKIEIK